MAFSQAVFQAAFESGRDCSQPDVLADLTKSLAIDGPVGRVRPRFQFMQNATLPGLEKVLAAISTDAHPVAVQRFFLGSSPDLFSETLDEGIPPPATG